MTIIFLFVFLLSHTPQALLTMTMMLHTPLKKKKKKMMMQQRRQQNLKDPDVGVVIPDTSVSPGSTTYPAAQSAPPALALIAEGLTVFSLWAEGKSKGKTVVRERSQMKNEVRLTLAL